VLPTVCRADRQPIRRGETAKVPRPVRLPAFFLDTPSRPLCSEGWARVECDRCVVRVWRGVDPDERGAGPHGAGSRLRAPHLHLLQLPRHGGPLGLHDMGARTTACLLLRWLLACPGAVKGIARARRDHRALLLHERGWGRPGDANQNQTLWSRIEPGQGGGRLMGLDGPPSPPIPGRPIVRKPLRPRGGVFFW
jgi:hypothetical protein